MHGKPIDIPRGERLTRSCVTLLTSIAHRRVEKMPSHRHRKEVRRASGYRKNEPVESEAPINSRVLSRVFRFFCFSDWILAMYDRYFAATR